MILQVLRQSVTIPLYYNRKIHMKQLLAIGNWKMYQNAAAVGAFLAESTDFIGKNENIQVILAPSMVHIPGVIAWKQAHDLPIEIAAQNVAVEADGALTGESSARQLQEAGAGYALVGHSERRQLFGENNAEISKKMTQCARAGLVPIVCVGETQEQKAAGNSLFVILEQLAAAFASDVAGWKEQLAEKRCIIAYEPVWAIGSGVVPTAAEVKEVVAAIKAEWGSEAQVVYGGSVSAENVQEFTTRAGSDGVLVGKASTTFDTFQDICKQMIG